MNKKVLWIFGGVTIAVAPLAVLMIFIVLMGGFFSSSAAYQQSQQCDVVAQDGSWNGTAAVAAGPVRWPVTGRWTPTSEFGWRVNPGNKLQGTAMLHNGLDMAMATPGPVVAVKDGVVKRVASDTNFGGNQVYIDIGDNTVVGYSHLRDPSTFKPGDKVKGGQQVGIEGATGNVTGPHLHFSVQKPYGTGINPRTWLDAQGLKVPPLFTSTDAPGVNVAPQGSGGGGVSAQPVAASSSSSSTASSSSGGASASLPLPTSNRSPSTSGNPKAIPIPANWKHAYETASAKYGIPWTLIAGIGAEETRQGQMVQPSSVGAQGPMQFMPATFAAEGVDGNGDGVKDIQNVDDAIHSTAAKLVRDGAKQGPEGVRKAIFAYNHADWYVQDVLYWAQAYGGGNVQITGASGAGSGCTNQGINATNASGQIPAVPDDGGSSLKIVSAVRPQLGVPYSWGGGGYDGPTLGTGSGAHTVGFDCSGLTIFAVYRGTGIKLPHLADDIAFDSRGQTIKDKKDLKPGDVIAFSEDGSGRKGSFGHIGIYVGGGKMIHAPNPSTVVKEVDLNTPYWNSQAWSIKRFAQQA